MTTNTQGSGSAPGPDQLSDNAQQRRPRGRMHARTGVLRSSWLRVGVVALGLASVGGVATSALWSDTAVTQTAVGTGTVKITTDNVNGTTAAPHVIDMLATGLAPGDTRTKAVTVRNAGTLPIKLSMATTNTGGTMALGSALHGRVTATGHTAIPVGPLNSVALSNISLAPGASTVVTLSITVPTNIANSFQGKTDTIRFTFTGSQV